MDIQMKALPEITVVGKEGATDEGAGFIQRLWAEANAHFGEVAALAARDEDGDLLGLWGAMSDCSRAFLPWEDGFTRGLYLAGVQARGDAQAPEGWQKWVIPAQEYVVVPLGGAEGFARGMDALKARGLSLAGAAHDFISPKDGREYVYLPVRKLSGEAVKSI